MGVSIRKEGPGTAITTSKANFNIMGLLKLQETSISKSLSTNAPSPFPTQTLWNFRLPTCTFSQNDSISSPRAYSFWYKPKPGLNHFSYLKPVGTSRWTYRQWQLIGIGGFGENIPCPFHHIKDSSGPNLATKRLPSFLESFPSFIPFFNSSLLSIYLEQ